jgi:hypothetical protein
MAALDIFSSGFESGMVAQKHHNAAQNTSGPLETIVPAIGDFSMRGMLAGRGIAAS